MHSFSIGAALIFLEPRTTSGRTTAGPAARRRATQLRDGDTFS